MKKLNCLYLVSLAISVLAFNLNTSAQTNTYITIEKVSVMIKNLNLTDSITPNNKRIHQAVFEIQLNSSYEIKSILVKLQKILRGTGSIKDDFSKLVISTKAYGLPRNVASPTSERTYSFPTISEISVPELNGSSKVALRLKIRMHSETVSVRYDVADELNIKPEETGITTVSMFSVRFLTLPTQSIYQIGSFSISGKLPTLQNISIQLAAAWDRQWNELYNANDGKPLGDVEITLMMPNFRDEVCRIILNDVRFIAYNSNLGNGDGPARVSYRLSVASALFK